jgi:Cu-Zn family superoxide dismutase
MRHSRHLVAALLGATALAAAASGVASADHGDRHASRTRVFTLSPDPAANPEGVAFSKALGAFFVSDTGSGAIYRGTLDSRTASPFIPGSSGGSAVGLKVVRGKLYAAGGSTGTIIVYDLASKQRLAQFDTGAGGFLNDLVVTRRGDVYVTDSTRPMLWHVTAAQVAAGTGTPQGIDVSQDIPFASGFNLNGIVADGDRRLVTVQTNTGTLFRIQLSHDGSAIRSVDAVEGVSVPGGDGLLLDGGRLVVVQGGPPAQISFVKLRHGDRRGQVRDVRTSALLKGPSTIARARDLYLVVNADFATSTKPFTVAGLPRNGDDGDRGDDNRNHGNGNNGNGHDQGDDHAPTATPTPYYGNSGDDNGHASATPSPTPTPYYGSAGGGDDNGSGGGNSGSGSGSGGGGNSGGGSGGHDGGGNGGGGCYYCGGHS